jgi:uncharacterized protein YqhQ
VEDLVGGQAIIEGVMVRQGRRWAAAARRDDGTIAVTDGTISARDAWWWRVPVLRGALAAAESVRVGLDATRWSQSLTREPDQTSVRERAAAVSVGLAVVTIFLLVPTSVAHAIVGRTWFTSLLEGALLLTLFVSYLWLLGRFPSIRRTFGYHGAEHMCVSSWEHEGLVSVDAARDHSVRHPRCGTDLLLMVVAVSIVLFRFLPGGLDPWALIARLLMVPVVAGIAYELLRLGGTSRWPVVRRVLSAPGLAAQRLTTAPPDDEQLEVAVAAMHHLVGTTVSATRLSRTSATR